MSSHQHGKFLPYDTHQTALALSCYAVGLAGYSLLKLVAPAFYALGDSRTPMLVSLASVLVNAIAAFAMVRLAGFGHAGLALTSSVVSTFSSLTLLFLLRAKVGRLDGRQLLIGLVKITGAAALMGIVCRAVVVASHTLLGTPWLARVVDIAVGIPAGLGAFYAIVAALRVPELAHEPARSCYASSAAPPDAFVKIRSSHAC